MTYVDLDKGGNFGYTTEDMSFGPSKGRRYKPNRLERIIASGASSKVQPWDSIVLLNLSPTGAYNLTLLAVKDWMNNEYGQIALIIKFLNDNGGASLTLIAATLDSSGKAVTDTIDGLSQVVTTPIVGIAPFPSLTVRPRSDLLGWIVT